MNKNRQSVLSRKQADSPWMEFDSSSFFHNMTIFFVDLVGRVRYLELVADSMIKTSWSSEKTDVELVRVFAYLHGYLFI